MSALIAAALASVWIIPAVSGLAAGIVAGCFGGDWGLALIAALTVGAAVLAYRLLGLKAALAALAAGAALFAYRFGERKGAASQSAKEKADADRRATARERTIDEVRNLPDAELRRRARRWVRDDR
ncbi:hypothetical protein Xaut_3727 [Xanthobacter versatilis]|uniref:Uncharacterized protein n=1 Tax=Xanthobacter autotrophicus (strain ATCC BAA-1158 / Py2) TaxID=78245 RepID=A7ILR0_XANP2|nr:hypothetical protein Xaut_3727 [Xanthobacter autotrophicus Py2]